MIFGRTIKIVWNKYKKDFLLLYNKELSKKVDAKDLQFRYVDLQGISYYGFGKDMSLPVDRLGKLYEFMEYLMKGMSASEDEAIDNAIEAAIETGLSNPKEKASAKVGSLIMERRKRRRMVIHSELLYNILAVQWVREDENPSVYSNEIQMAKVEQFKREVGEGSSYPFFQVPELRQLNSFLKMSKDEWDQFWNESIIQQKVLIEALRTIYTSETELKQYKTTSTLV